MYPGKPCAPSLYLTFVGSAQGCPRARKQRPHMIPMERFTRHAQEAVVRTQTIARELGHSTVEPEHLLVALLEQQGGPVPQALGHLNVDTDAITGAVRRQLSGVARES